MRMGGLKMRPYDPRRDLFALLTAYADPAEQAQFAVRAPVGDVRAFDVWLSAQLRGPYQDFRVAEDAVTGEFAGFAHSYDVRLADGHCKVCTYVTPAYRAAGGGAWLAAAFIGELFALYPLRKIYAAVYAYNAASLASCSSAGFEEECRLREYRYFDGAYHDCVLLSLTREQYGERVAPLVGGLAAAAEKGGADGAALGGGVFVVPGQPSPPEAAAERRAPFYEPCFLRMGRAALCRFDGGKRSFRLWLCTFDGA